ncbi:MAG: phosphate/phosphite/phosphonate ABC transporter substrate-binding protein [Candidatus Obscuribacterales bacterium]|nr:phosphate/phosphite/phosphonate ABC transporter substrate-binding protein [Candidatus Obscuribacterales bacterium]
MKTTLLGAVAYTAKVVDIWEGIKEFFITENCPFDFVLFSNYEAQINALLNGFIDVAWNTNLAFVKTDNRLSGKTRLLAMRDTDIGFTSKIVTRKGTLGSTKDLEGKTLALGSRDSAQAALMPEYFLQLEGLYADKNYKCLRFNSDIGKHGDTGKSELEVLTAIREGKADAGAIGVSTWESLRDIETNMCEIWTSPSYSHCVFNALPEIDEAQAKCFVDTLMHMDYANPAHRRLLDLEGLKKWEYGSRDGYSQIFDAAKALSYV